MINLVHGRLLRIMLSSVLYRSLEHMSDFTHHNCCINVLDVQLESNPANFSDNPLIDTYNILSKIEHSGDQEAGSPVLKPTLLHSSLSNPKPFINTLQKSLEHPRNLKFIPIALDDRRHLEKNGLDKS